MLALLREHTSLTVFNETLWIRGIWRSRWSWYTSERSILEEDIPAEYLEQYREKVVEAVAETDELDDEIRREEITNELKLVSRKLQSTLVSAFKNKGVQLLDAVDYLQARDIPPSRV